MMRRKEYRNSINRNTVPPGNLAEQIVMMLKGMSSTDMLLPTPMACEGHKNMSCSKQKYISNMARDGLLPTPTNSMATYQDLEQAKYHSSKRPKYSEILLPTPTSSSDTKGGCTRPNPKRQNDTLAHSIHGMIGEPGKTSQLNPRFVAEMMGFPPNWTELPFLNGETKA